MTILAGDIGKEKSNLALFSHKKDSSGSIIINPDIEPIIQTFETKYEVSELQKMIEVFLKDNYDPHQKDIYGACFSIAALVDQRKATLSDGNKSVTFSEQDFKQKLPYPNVPVAFLNDMEAIGYDIFLGNEESILQEIHKQERLTDPKDSRALMLVSDGLGAAKWICRDEKKGDLEPDSSEWGHGDFAARTDSEKKILQYLEARRKDHKDHTPVSREYTLSKRGLQRIYHSLENPEIYDNQSFSLEPEAIVEKGLQGDSLCKSSLDLFMAIWGAEMGNLALTFKAEGGVYIVTDLPIPLDKFKEGAFIEAFLKKEPEKMGFRDFLNKIPIFLIQEPNIGIWGAARYAINKGFITKGKFAIMRANQ
ncbi:glucokinase [Planktothrix rubescens]|uniref:glucokinase n=1 Tax=Planktothrix rubescens TaxID=59512 RepID=UPI000411F02F|nr:glucokinase [Planktothrix rubescens]